jgi:mRNA-degrading endonuclease YafQ of YafQ-DinJ toxin-antitoxin module
MLNLIYAPAFLRQYNKLEPSLQIEVQEKIKLFQDERNHKSLKVHKLHGRFSDSYSFSVNYKDRVVFEYLSKNEVALLCVGDHDVYSK